MLARIVLRRTFVALLGCALTLVGWLLLTPATPISAVNTLHVTQCTDSGVSGDGSLRGEILAAGTGDTIVFDQTCMITLGSTLTLTKNLTISGPTSGTGVTLNGGGRTRSLS